MSDLSLDLIVGDDAAACQVTYTAQSGYTATEVGTSKRHPKDKPDPEIAEWLAAGRALHALGDELIRHAETTMAMKGPWRPTTVTINMPDVGIRQLTGEPYTDVPPGRRRDWLMESWFGIRKKR